MNRPGIEPGQVLPLVRTIQPAPDALALYRRLCDGGRKADTLLLEQEGGRCLVVVQSALRAVCRGRTVSVEALSANGHSLLPWLARMLSDGAKVESVERGLRVEYAPPPRGNDETRLKASSPVDVLRAMARGPEVLSGESLCAPLLAGTFEYDLLASYEGLPLAQGQGSDWPDFEFWLPDQMLWLDPRRGATVVAHVHGGERCALAYHDAVDAIGRLAQACALTPEPAPAAAVTAPPRGVPEASVDLDDREYCALVERMKQHIYAGDVFQIVPSRTFRTPCADPVDAYARLRRMNPSPYMFLVNGSAGVLFGASPETALRVDGDPRRVELRPIAGTRPRGADPDQDSRMEAELRLDEKELAEHMMLVDLARNDVARVCQPGTRSVDRLLTVQRSSHVMHLVSHVSGILRHDLDAVHAYVATMNMGTLVGAPKLMAATLLRQNEQGRRGAYGGAIGYFTADGRMDSAIVIRSAVVRDGIASVRAGAGIVHDSVPALEAAETRKKAEAVLRAILEVQP